MTAWTVWFAGVMVATIYLCYDLEVRPEQTRMFSAKAVMTVMVILCLAVCFFLWWAILIVAIFDKIIIPLFQKRKDRG